MHDTIYHAITYCKWLHRYWGASEDNIVKCSLVGRLRYLDLIFFVL